MPRRCALEERELSERTRYDLIAERHFDCLFRSAVGRDQRETDISLEPVGPGTVCKVAESTPVPRDCVPTGLRGNRLAPFEYYPELMSPWPGTLNLAQRLNPDDLTCQTEIDILAQPHLKRIGLCICVTAIGQKTTLDALGEIGSPRTDAPALPRFPHEIPELRPLHSVHQIQLKTALF